MRCVVLVAVSCLFRSAAATVGRSALVLEGCPTPRPGIGNKEYFQWSRTMGGYSYYWTGSSPLKFHCDSCVFPQDLGSFTFSEGKGSYTMYHPYMEGHKGGAGDKSSSSTFKCGSRLEYCQVQDVPEPAAICSGDNWWRLNAAKKYIPTTKVPSGAYGCHAVPCTLLFSIYSRTFYQKQFNGYYIAHFSTSKRFKPTYRHSSRPILIFETDPGKYLASAVAQSDQETPNKDNTCVFKLEIAAEVPHEVTLGGMATRFCFPSHSHLQFRETYIDYVDDAKRTEDRQVELNALPFQCGLTYRDSENYMFSTGSQPFVVDIQAGVPRCKGVIVSPQHVLTMARCLDKKDRFRINEAYGQKGWCRGPRLPLHGEPGEAGVDYLASYKDCPRWFALRGRAFDDNHPGPAASDLKITTMQGGLGSSSDAKDLAWDWVEPHPLYDGSEYDFVLIGLRDFLNRNSMAYPICLPKFDIQRPGDKLYPTTKWENYQLLYSLKALHKDQRFYTTYTDVNGPAKFVKCLIKDETAPPQSMDSYCYNERSPGYHNFTDLIPADATDSQIRYDLGGNHIVYKKEDVHLRDRYQCDVFYEILEKEERYPFLKENQRQIKNLQRGVIECFAVITIEFVEESVAGIRCYERRKKCLKLYGWCFVNEYDYGFCSEANKRQTKSKTGLPDTVSNAHPLLEVQTYIYPKAVDQDAVELFIEPGDASSKHTFQKSETMFVYEIVDYIAGIQRPLVKSPDTAGRMRVLKSYPVQETWSGQDVEPGNAYAVLYSMQRINGRWWDFTTYQDTESLVAHSEVVNWILEIFKDVDKFPNYYDPDMAQIKMDLKTTTNFHEAWGHSPPFDRYFDKELGKVRLDKFKTFDVYWSDRLLKLPGRRLVTKPPIIYVEGYDYLNLEDDKTPHEKDHASALSASHELLAFTTISILIAYGNKRR